MTVKSDADFIKRCIMSKAIRLDGNYQRSGSYLTKIDQDNIQLVISYRQKPTSKKTESFLLIVNPDTGKRSYVSSLYQDNAGKCYSFDYKNIAYILCPNPGTDQFTINLKTP